jgi:hypothetical protein
MRNLPPPPRQAELHLSTRLSSTTRHNFFILAKVEVIQNVVPSSLNAAAADDAGLFSHVSALSVIKRQVMNHIKIDEQSLIVGQNEQ